MALADVPLSLSPSSPHRVAHHVRLPTTPPTPLPPPSCAVAKEATTAAYLRSSTTADPPRPPRSTAGPPPPRGDQELRLAESYAILEPCLLGSRGSTESLPSPPTRASPIFPDPFKRIRVPRRCSGPLLVAAGGPLLATSPPLDCLLCSLGVVVHRSPPLDGWRSSAPKYRPCSGACTPPALPHPTLRHHLPHPELGFTTPTALQFELRLDLIPAAAVFPEPRKPSSDTLSSATCFSNHCQYVLSISTLQVSVVQDQRQESAKYDDENKANDGEPSSIEAEQSIGILSFNAHPKFQLPEIKASFSRCRSKLPHFCS
ncbi:unnamed protein product [Triticum turgidum subsp. durum]|uniref:Uncharacterized protein n=1 Tax=Triticum turgidum subsp. durum TaxID=4567 RepID=A0A9R0SPS4_TRITD|nr:unnamed protein product [Triticum turgidum subsp. durum]